MKLEMDVNTDLSIFARSVAVRPAFAIRPMAPSCLGIGYYDDFLDVAGAQQGILFLVAYFLALYKKKGHHHPHHVVMPCEPPSVSSWI